MVYYDVVRLLQLLEPYEPPMFKIYKQELFLYLSEQARRFDAISSDVFMQGITIEIPASYLVQAKNFSYAEAYFVAAVSNMYDEWRNLNDKYDMDTQLKTFYADVRSDTNAISDHDDFYGSDYQEVMNAIKLLGTSNKLYDLTPMDDIEGIFEDDMVQEMDRYGRILKTTGSSGISKYARFLSFPVLTRGARLAKRYGSNLRERAIIVVKKTGKELYPDDVPRSLIQEVNSSVLVYT